MTYDKRRKINHPGRKKDQLLSGVCLKRNGTSGLILQTLSQVIYVAKLYTK